MAELCTLINCFIRILEFITLWKAGDSINYHAFNMMAKIHTSGVSRLSRMIYVDIKKCSRKIFTMICADVSELLGVKTTVHLLR